MAAIGKPHAVCVRKVTGWCYSNLPLSDVIILVQDPVEVRPRSMPQPDLAVGRFTADQYLSKHPGPEDILLLIEVSDTTLGYDRRRKLDFYANARIPDYWIFALALKRILVHRKPEGGRYTEVLEVGPGQTISPQAFPDIALSVDAIFG
jgi:Uma2 family endonuclease